MKKKNQFYFLEYQMVWEGIAKPDILTQKETKKQSPTSPPPEKKVKQLKPEPI